MNSFCMYKRGVLLIGTLIFVFSFNLINVEAERIYECGYIRGGVEIANYPEEDRAYQDWVYIDDEEDDNMGGQAYIGQDCGGEGFCMSEPPEGLLNEFGHCIPCIDSEILCLGNPHKELFRGSYYICEPEDEVYNCDYECRNEGRELWTSDCIVGSGCSNYEHTGVDADSNGWDDVCEAEFVCGDGVREGDEVCDGGDLNEQTCSDMRGGYNNGFLRCNPPDIVRGRGDGRGLPCTFDVSECYYEPEDVDLDLSINGEGGRRVRMVNSCPGASERINLVLTNHGRSVENVYIYDSIYYDADCDGIGRIYFDYSRTEFECGNVGFGESCRRSYDDILEYSFPGCYYHNSYVSQGRIEDFIEG